MDWYIACFPRDDDETVNENNGKRRGDCSELGCATLTASDNNCSKFITKSVSKSDSLMV